MTILEHARAFLGHRSKAAHVSDEERIEIQAEQRYRTMAGMDEPLELRAERARSHAKKLSPLGHKTW